jgi:hypothetical protein
MHDDKQPSQISESRKNTYYLGMGMAGIGLVLFFVPFLGVACALMSGPSDPSEIVGPAFAIGIFGFILVFAGSIVMGIGRRGAAGSGLILDPDKAREDLKPWSKMAGGMLDDTLSEVKPVQKVVEHLTEEHAAPHEPPQAIKVRCRECHSLNDEDARFCDQCGGQL